MNFLQLSSNTNINHDFFFIKEKYFRYHLKKKSVIIGIQLQSTTQYAGVKQHWPWFVLGWVTVLVCQFLLINSHSDETFKPRSFALLLRRQYEFHFRIDIVQFSIYFFFLYLCLKLLFVVIVPELEEKIWLSVSKSLSPCLSSQVFTIKNNCLLNIS